MVSICFVFTIHFNYTAQNAFRQLSERSFCRGCIVNKLTPYGINRVLGKFHLHFHKKGSSPKLQLRGTSFFVRWANGHFNLFPLSVYHVEYGFFKALAWFLFRFLPIYGTIGAPSILELALSLGRRWVTDARVNFVRVVYRSKYSCLLHLQRFRCDRTLYLQMAG